MNQDINNSNQNNFNNQEIGIKESSPFNSSNTIENENKTLKVKNNFPIILIIAVVIIVTVLGCLFIFCGDYKSNVGKEENKKSDLKEITYFNSATKNEKDKLFLSLNNTSENGIGVLFAIDEKGVANNLKGGSYFLNNGVFSLNDYSSQDEFSISINGSSFIFGLELESYKKNKDGEKLEDGLIVYTENNYVITHNNIGSYSLYYKYDESYNKKSTDEEKWGSWYTVFMAFYDTLEGAKEKIKQIEEQMDICLYKVEEGYDNCVTTSGKQVNYKEYKNIKDVLVDSLIDYGLYVDSYENISYVDSAEVFVKNDVTLDGIKNDSKTEFEIEFDANELEPERIVATSKLNGKEVQFEKPYSIYYATVKTDLGYIEIMIDLAYGAEETNKNVIKALEETFKKTK